MSTSLNISGDTDIGRVRARNEDSLELDPDAGLAVVADGMGGHPGGDVASRLASLTAMDVLRGHLREASGESLGDAMTRAVAQAHERVRQECRAHPELRGMGTTLTAIAVDARSGAYAIGHVGDSRAYLFEGGRLRQLTRDHTWVQERVDARQLTPEQARGHPFGHMLSQCVGMEESPEPEVLVGVVEPGQSYLLCTDGLVGMLTDDEVASLMAEADDPEDASRSLIEAANVRGGHDNVTLAIVSVGASESTSA